VDKLRPFCAQPLDDVAVVHDLMADIDRRPVFLERALDDLDRSFDPGAKASRLGQHHSHLSPHPLRATPGRAATAWRYPCCPIPATIRALRAMLRRDAAIAAAPTGGGILPLCATDPFAIT